MTEEERRAHAEELIQSHATDIEFLAIHEMADGFISDVDAVAIYEMLAEAVVTVTWPDAEARK